MTTRIRRHESPAALQLVAVLLLVIFAAAAAATASSVVGEEEDVPAFVHGADGRGGVGGAAPVGGGEGDPRPSVALIVDVSGGKEALPSHAPLWQGVAHAVAAGGKVRVTVLLVAGENVRK